MSRLFAVPLLVAIAASTLAAQEPSSAQPSKISVNGEALVYAKPDRIILNFGIETRHAELLVAKRANAEIWKEAAAALKELGVPDKEIQTDYLSIEPRYRDNNDVTSPIGYVARTMFIVTLSDPAKVEALISRMLGVGVNRVIGVEFQTTQFKQHRQTARELALRAAREKAQEMAAVLGCTVGKPLAISESYSGGSGYLSSWSSGSYGRSSAMSQNTVQDLRGSGDDDPESVALGKISIRAGVSATFELTDGSSDAKKP